MADADGECEFVRRDEVVAGIRGLLLADFDLKVTNGTDLIEMGHLDSLDVIRLLAAMEERFGLRIEWANVEVRDIATVNGLADLVGRHT